jgi:eukaryotic-like serine/threonine-protein kinase
VRHQSLGSLHALKVLTWDRPSVDRRLLLEGQIQAQLRHPNVVAVTDVMRVNGRAALLLDFVNGPTLDAYLASKPANLDALEIFSGIIAAVVRAHDAGVLHRDLKPQNILLEPKGDGFVAKVTDFGLAKVLEEEMAAARTRADVTMGTPGYMAPEQVRDAASVDTRTDIFALGALLHELLGGRPAFADEDGHITLTATLEREAPPLPDTVPAHLRDAVAAALSADPNDRPATARELAERVFLPDDIRRRDVLALGGTPLALEQRRDVIPTWSSVDQRTAPPSPPRPTVVPLTSVPNTVVPDGPSEAPSRWPMVAVFVLTAGLGVGGAWFVGSQLLGASPADTPIAETPVAAPPVVEPPVATPNPEPLPVAEPDDEPDAIEAVDVADAPEPAPVQVAGDPADAVADAVADVAQVPEPPTPDAPEPVPAPQTEPEPTPDRDPTPPAPAPEAIPPVDTTDPGAASAATAQRFVGTWTGVAQGRPFSLRIDSVNAGAARGALIFTGPSQRITEMSGTAEADSVRLSDASGSVILKARMDGDSLTGAYSNGRRDVPFTAKR